MLGGLINGHRESGGLVLAAIHRPLAVTASATLTMGGAG
jgi:ABC-type transport system involved in cytochrome c biogenesis ATPase subunit